MLVTYQSNQLETLADQFARQYADQSADPLVADQVVVQNAGMARWLSLRLADRLGIAANLEFLFPAEFSWSLLRNVLGGLPESAPFSPGPLAWRILSVLETSGHEYAELKTYLDNLDQQGAFQLARQLERLFDQYLFYRPQWISEWEAGKDNRWQARLWRALRQTGGEARHWLDLQEAFLRALPQSADKLPQRISFFGISELSPGYLRLLGASAEYFDIHVYLMNPCREYWNDIVSEKIKLRPDKELQPYLEIGNPLLASLGRQGRDFLDMLLQEQADTHEEFVTPAADTVLAQIQRDVLGLLDRSGPEKTAETLALDRDDSLQIHSCHTALREVEILHDQILDMLDRHGGLEPSDIIVMMPVVDDYASSIEAVFSSAARVIPYSIADRKLLDATVSGQLLQHLLDIPESRYEVNRILDIVETEPVQSRFGLDENSVERIRHWCDVLRVRWGIDGAMRCEMDFLDTDEHSWRAAIKRLLLGCMLDEDVMFGGMLPYREVEGGGATVLGRFVALLEKLFALKRWREWRLTMADWVGKFSDLLTTFMTAEEAHHELQAIRDALSRVLQQSQQAGYQQPIEYSLARKLALDALSVELGQSRFINGGVTFCELAPMRSVPFKLVCLIGMEDSKFPRPVRRLSFDLMADSQRRGDRSQRLQDRYLFLESIMAARQGLYISYVGQSVKDNKDQPPSVLVSELLDYVHDAYGITPEKLVTKQPLQAFSRRYLDGGELFTYENYGLSTVVNSATQTFITEAIPSDVADALYLTDLEDFIYHPVRFYLQKSLGLARHWEESELLESEPFTLGPFDPKAIRQQLDTVPDDLAMDRLRAMGMLPHGTVGDQVVQQQQTALERLRNRRPKSEELPPRHVSLQLGDIMLAGSLENLTDQGLIQLNYDKPYHSDALRLWVRHLVLQVSDVDYLQQSRLIYPDGEIALRPVENARQQLEGLIEAWQTGREQPLRFMPKSAYAWANTSRSSRAGNTPEQNARLKWNSGDYPESGDLAYKIAFRGIDDLFNRDFERWAEQIWGSFLDAGGKLP